MKTQSIKSLPLVSIVIPAYNAAQFIGYTLNSAIQQTYKNIEVIVVDDGSKDNTADIVRSFARSDSRITLISQLNSGVSAARNQGIKKSKGEFFALIDADDIYYPQAIEKLTNTILQADDTVGLVYTWSIYIDEKGNVVGGCNRSQLEGDVSKILLETNIVGNASATLIRKLCIDKAGYFDREILPGCADWDFFLKIAEYYQFKVVPEFLIGYRKLSTSMSSDFTKMEKAYQQIVDNAYQRNPNISAKSLSISKSWYFLYLSVQSRLSRKYNKTFIYLYRAFISNKKIFTDSYVHQIFVFTLLEIAISPIGFIFNMDNATWKKFLRRLKRSYLPTGNILEIYKITPEPLSK